MCLSDYRHIYRAPWLVPVAQPVIADGAVVVEGDHILAVGTFAAIREQYPDLALTAYQGVLIPALVNAHIHLDLSVLGTVYPETPTSSMCDWINSLLTLREQKDFSLSEIVAAANKTIRQQYMSGVGLILDIGNVSLQYDTAGTEIISLLEVLGPSRDAQNAVIDNIENLTDDSLFTGHAPYSTGPDLLGYLKKRCDKQGSVFSLHLAENIDELLLLQKGTGCFADFLQCRGAMDGTFPISGIDRKGVVGYLNDLGLLNKKTLCVHCVHLNDEEIEILAESNAGICLCPSSNRFLHVGVAPVQKFTAAGILPALGTDSIASNPNLDLWNEMSILSHCYPEIDADVILQMATIGGARALANETIYGSLSPGCTSRFLSVQAKAYENAKNSADLLEQLTRSGRPASITWVHPSHTR